MDEPYHDQYDERGSVLDSQYIDPLPGAVEDSIRVFVRIRPLNKRELQENQQSGWNFNETSMIEDTQNGQRVYSFDKCFSPTSTNQLVYDIVGKPMVLKTMEGYNGTVFSYGQTGSGKTWTMRGNDADPGMMILCIRDIFEWIETHSDMEYTLRASYLEVYNEEINDLLGDGVNSKNLRILSEDAIRGAVIDKLIEQEVSTTEDFMAVLAKGEAARQYAATQMNAESSRSHTIYRVVVKAQTNDRESKSRSISEGEEHMMLRRNSSHSSNIRISYLNLVDLAGSERQKQTNASGKTLKEGANINKSLLALGACISKLGEASKKGPAKAGSKPIFIPFRDSKLTRILKNSLAGNTMTSIMCAVTPALMHREETVSTLKFGQLCKTIKTNVKNMEVLDDQRLMKLYRQQIQELRNQLEERASQNIDTPIFNRVKHLESYILMNDLPIPPTEQPLPLDSTSEALTVGDLSASNQPSMYVNFSNARLLQEENQRQSDRVNELQKQLLYYERKFEEFRDFEEAKAAFDEYETNIRNDLDDERAKLESELQSIQEEKYKILSERTSLEEKETRLSLLLTSLDEKDSNLRQAMNTINELKLNLNLSIADLMKREEAVAEYQKTYAMRESKIDEKNKVLESKYLDISNKESKLAELENKLALQGREVTEREQRVQMIFSRVANTEKEYQMKNDALMAQENALKKREFELSLKEQDWFSKQAKLVSYEALITDKEDNLASQQKDLEREEARLTQQAIKLSEREGSYERKSLEMNKLEGQLHRLHESYTVQYKELEQREASFANRLRDFEAAEASLKERLESTAKLSEELEAKAIKYQDLEEKERDLASKIAQHTSIEEEFYSQKVADIARRHIRDKASLELIISQQANLMANYQADAARFKEEVKALKEELANIQSQPQSSKLNIDVAAHDASEYVNTAAQSNVSVTPNNRRTQEPTQPVATSCSDEDELLTSMKDSWASLALAYSQPGSLEEEKIDETWEALLQPSQTATGSTTSRPTKTDQPAYLSQLANAQLLLEQLLVAAKKPPQTSNDRRYIRLGNQLKERKSSGAERRSSLTSSVMRPKLVDLETSQGTAQLPTSPRASVIVDAEKSSEPQIPTYRGHTLTTLFSDIATVMETPPPPPPVEETPVGLLAYSVEDKMSISASPLRSPPSSHHAGETSTTPVSKVRLKGKEKSVGKEIKSVIVDKGFRGGVPVTSVTLASSKRGLDLVGISPQKHWQPSYQTTPSNTISSESKR